MAETLADAAERYASMGWAVFPLRPRGKEPRTKNGVKDACCDIEQVRAFWERFPDSNIGIAMGEPSGGLVAIDVDEDGESGKDGMAAVRAWERGHGELPETATALTGRGGTHMLYRMRGVKNSVNAELAVDIRSTGGYIVAPPSIHPNGSAYAWECDPEEYPVADADDNVRAFVASVQPRPRERGERLSAKDAPKKGGRNNTLYRMACSLQAQDWDDDAIVHAITTYNADKCEPPLPEHEVEKLLESALSLPKGRTSTVAVRGERVQDDECDAEEVPALTTTEKGTPHQTIENCYRAIMRDARLEGRIYYDERAYTKMLVGPVPWDDRPGERPVSDADYCGLAAYLERWYWLTSKNKAIDALTLAAMKNRRNPVKEWLEGLEWDGTERVETLLSVFLGAEPNEYDAAVMRTFMAGACARACEPGVKFDYMPVLHGPQGIGKSMFLRRLGTRSDWYCDNFNTLDGDAAAEKLRGMWVVELAELLATKRSRDVEGIKAFITSTVDTIRPKYARETEQRPRTCVFAGTTNSSTFLTDATGNRRFLPVACGVYEPAMSLFEDGAEDYFAQAWAEAYARWKGGEWGLVLDLKRQDEAMQMQAAYTEEDVRVGIIQEYLSTCEPDARVCAIEIAENALHVEGGNPPRKLINEIHEIMRNSIDGWVPYGKLRARTPYGVQRCYVRSGSAEAAT